MKKPTDLKKAIAKATAPKKGTKAEVAAAQVKGAALKKKQVAHHEAARDSQIKSVVRSETSRKPGGGGKKLVDVSPQAHSKAVEKAAQKTAPVSGAKLSAGLKKATSAMAKLMKVGTNPKARPTAGRKADPNSARQLALKAREQRIKAGLTSGGRGRPKSPTTLAREKEKAEFKAKRAAEGKDTRGRKASPTSKRSLRAKRQEVKTQETLSPTPDAGIRNTPRKPGLRPSEAQAGFNSMKPLASTEGSMYPERGLHQRGKTQVSYMLGGSHKMQRRTVTMKGSRGGESKITVMRNLKKSEDSDRYRPFHSYRQKDAKDTKIEESIRHHPSDPGKTMRTKFTKTRSAAGLESERMEVGQGRRSQTSVKVRGGKTKVAPILGMPSSGASHVQALEHKPNTPSGAGRDSLKSFHAMRSEGTMPSSFDKAKEPAKEARPEERREVARTLSQKKSMRGKK